MPDPITVSNSSGLIALESIGRLDVLRQLYGTVTIPPAVFQECGAALPTWFSVQAVQNQELVRSLRMNLGAGESEAIALASELSAARVILDDKKARRTVEFASDGIARRLVAGQATSFRFEHSRSDRRTDSGAVLHFGIVGRGNVASSW